MPNDRLPTNFQHNIFIFVAIYGKPSNFTPVIEAKRQEVGPDRECPKIAFHYAWLGVFWMDHRNGHLSQLNYFPFSRSIFIRPFIFDNRYRHFRITGTLNNVPWPHFAIHYADWLWYRSRRSCGFGFCHHECYHWKVFRHSAPTQALLWKALLTCHTYRNDNTL